MLLDWPSGVVLVGTPAIFGAQGGFDSRSWADFRHVRLQILQLPWEPEYEIDIRLGLNRMSIK